jgi:ABC-type transporter Mla maintaining outer membrane lipid asymmetry permease subunit MlaE
MARMHLSNAHAAKIGCFSLKMARVRSSQTHLVMFSSVDSRNGWVTEFFEWFGDIGVFSWQVFRAAVTPPFELHELFLQLDEVGSKSLPLAALAGAAVGVVLSMESRYSLTRFGRPIIHLVLCYGGRSTP